MVRNGVSVPIHWHVFVQVGPPPRDSTPMVVVYGDCGASSPDKKRGRRAGGGFVSPAKVNAEEFHGLIADTFRDNFKRDFKAGSSHCCYENELAYKIFTLIVLGYSKYFVYSTSWTAFT
jgi:hypothetical protein